MRPKADLKRSPNDNEETRRITEEIVKNLEKSGERGFIDTPTSRIIMRVDSQCHARRKFGMVIGRTAIGKTTGHLRYSETHDGVVFYSCDPMDKTPDVFLQRLAKVIQDKEYFQYVTFDRRSVHSGISKSLKDSDALLVIDESQFLSPDSIEHLRIICCDEAHVGLVLAGNPWFFRRLADSERYDQIMSRVYIVKDLKRLQPGDVLAIASRYGIKGSDELKILESISENPAGLRGLIDTLQDLERCAKRQNRPISRELLLAVLENRGLDFGGEIEEKWLQRAI